MGTSQSQLLLLKRGGEEIYVGSLGRHSSDLIKYFEGIQGVSKIRDGHNPATWMLEVTAPAQETALGIDFSQVYLTSKLYRRTKALISELSTPNPGNQELSFPSRYCEPFYKQCINACLWKQYWSYWRNPPYTAVRFLFTAFVALIFGSMYWDLGSRRNSVQDINNAMGSMFGSVLFLGILNSVSVQPVVGVERAVFYRERAAGMYSSMTYAVAQVLIEFPYIFSQAMVYSVIVYAMTGYEWMATKLFWYIFFMYFTLLYFTFFGMMCLAMAPNHHIAAIISGGFITLWTLFAGYIIPRPRIPIWWRWYYWACPVSWTLYGLTASQYGDIESYLLPGVTVKEFLKSYYGFRHDFLGIVAGMIVAYTLLFIFAFGYLIKQLNFQKR